MKDIHSSLEHVAGHTVHNAAVGLVDEGAIQYRTVLYYCTVVCLGCAVILYYCKRLERAGLQEPTVHDAPAGIYQQVVPLSVVAPTRATVYLLSVAWRYIRMRAEIGFHRGTSGTVVVTPAGNVLSMYAGCPKKCGSVGKSSFGEAFFVGEPETRLEFEGV